jgi:transcriptional regulator with XRE-family HTH domain
MTCGRFSLVAMASGNELIRKRVLELIQEEARVNPRGASRRLAQRIGVAESVISDIKRGERSRMKPENLQKAAQEYRKSPAWFYADDDQPPGTESPTKGPVLARHRRDKSSPSGKHSSGGVHVASGTDTGVLRQRIADLESEARGNERLIDLLLSKITDARRTLDVDREKLAGPRKRRS